MTSLAPHGTSPCEALRRRDVTRRPFFLCALPLQNSRIEQVCMAYVTYKLVELPVAHYWASHPPAASLSRARKLWAALNNAFGLLMIRSVGQAAAATSAPAAAPAPDPIAASTRSR